MYFKFYVPENVNLTLLMAILSEIKYANETADREMCAYLLGLKHWLGEWLVAQRHQAITWTNVDVIKFDNKGLLKPPKMSNNIPLKTVQYIRELIINHTKCTTYW